MATQTKSSRAGTGLIAVGLVVFGLAAIFHKSKPSDDDRNFEQVVVTVTFSPSPRTEPVHVTVWVGTAMPPVEEELVIHSPWAKTLRVPKGWSVSVQAEQASGNAACRIVADGMQVAGNEHQGAGSTYCYYNHV